MIIPVGFQPASCDFVGETSLSDKPCPRFALYVLDPPSGGLWKARDFGTITGVFCQELLGYQKGSQDTGARQFPKHWVSPPSSSLGEGPLDEQAGFDLRPSG